MSRVGIIAGEVSGDLLGAGLINALLAHNPTIQFEGIAGAGMQAAGCEAWYDSDELAVMGLTEVLKDLPRLLKIKKEVIRRWRLKPPDIFIGIDAPDFNLGVEKQLKQEGIATAHYVSPSVWAWRENRINTIEKAVDDLFCILPFEPDYYSDTRVQAHFVGHPMADAISIKPMVGNINNEAFKIAILPGSRASEIAKLAKPFFQCIAILAQRYPTASFYIPLAKERYRSQLESLLKQFAPGVPVKIQQGQTSEILSQSDIALIASGTATLEAMLNACPMVVAYRMAASTSFLLRISKSIKTRYFSLPNIIANKELVTEILQEDVNAKRLSDEISILLDNAEKRKKMCSEFSGLHTILKQNANNRVAEIILNRLNAISSAAN